jgi:glycerate dehydrogenase
MSPNLESRTRPRIVVLDGYTANPGDNPWTELAEVGALEVYERSALSEILPRARGASVLVTNKTPLSAATLAALPELRGISVLATGVNVVDVGAARARGIVVSNVPAYSTASVAQHTLALLLELSNRVGLHDASVRAGQWQRSLDFCYWEAPLLDLAGRRLGIVGYGEIGKRVAQAASALGMQVVAARFASRTQKSSEIPRLDLDELFCTSDVISLHCPLTAETERLISGARLRSLKPSALLINTARGGLVDEAELASALSSGALGGAALDVLSSEPPSANHPLLGLPNCIVTPHVAWTSLESRRRLLRVTVENVRGILAGQPVHVVTQY